MNASLDALMDRLLESYRATPELNNTVNLPSKRAVAEMCEEVLRVLLPGFIDEPPISEEDLEAVAEARIMEISQRLQEEICKSLRVENPRCPREQAEAIAFEFLGHLSGIRYTLRTDIEAAYEGDPAARSYAEILLAYPSIETVAIQRVAHILYQAEVPLIPRMMTEWAHSRTGIDIHPGASIGSHFFIDHGTGVVIGETCRIGNHVKLYHGVTLGAKSFQKDDEGRILKGGKRHPDVEDYVTIYPGSTILGGETVIGARSTIGGNVFLMHSVPPSSLVFYEETQLRILQKPIKQDASAGFYEI